MALVRVSQEGFDSGRETVALLARAPGAGGLASFLGIVRTDDEHPIAAMTLEHYPGMTQRALETIAADAERRFGLLGSTIIHRHGRLVPGEPIVLVLAAASHRAAALDGCAFLIDWLKTSAPFWKKEQLLDGSEHWVEARAADDDAAARWG